MFKHYFATALRHLRKHKITTAVNVLCLMLGMLCFLGAHGVAIMLASSDSQFPNSDRIYALTQRVFTPGANIAVPTLPFTSIKPAAYLKSDFPELEAVARLTLSFEGALSVGDMNTFGKISYADADFFKILSHRFLYGDPATALRNNASIVLTESMATRLFGSPANALGQFVIAYGRVPVTVTGVIQPVQGISHLGSAARVANFDAIASMDLLMLSPIGKMVSEQWSAPFTFTYLLLPTDSAIDSNALQTRLATFDERHIPKDEWHSEFNVIPVTSVLAATLNTFVGSDKSGVTFVGVLYVLGCIALGIAALNYANLAAAQGISHAKEVGLRRALGARRTTIALQYIGEATLVASLAALLAFALFVATLSAVRPQNIPASAFYAQYVLSQLPLLFGLVIVVGFVAGAYPASTLLSTPVTAALHAGKANTRRFGPALLVGLQFFATSILVIAIIVMSSQYKSMEQAALSTIGDPLVVITNRLDSSGVSFDTLQRELIKHPEIRVVSATMEAPWSIAGSVMTVSASRDDAASRWTVCNNIVQQHFLAAMGLQLIAGRDFNTDIASDQVKYLELVSHNRTVSQDGAAAIIDRSLATQNGWSPDQAIGKEIYLWVPGANAKSTPMLRVIGVVENKPIRLLGIGASSNLFVQAPDAAALPIIRVNGKNTKASLEAIDKVWQQLAPNVSIKRQLADEVLADSLKIFAAITAAFKGVAMTTTLIALLGLIGMSLHIISQRTHEIGVRKTLGASVTRILALLLKDLSKPVLIANLIAWPVAFGAMSIYLSMFVTRTSLTLAPFLTSLLFALLIAWTAVFTQAIRAARLKPATVLRHE